jgi:hypothetical protein
LLLLLVHLAVLHDLEVRLCPHHDRLCYRLDLLTLRSATLGLITFAQIRKAGNSAIRNLNFLRIRAARGCETDLDHRLLKILLVLLGHPLFLHRNRRVHHGLLHLVRLWVCMPSLCMLKGYNWRDVAVMELQLEFRENYFLPVAASAHWPKLVKVTCG